MKLFQIDEGYVVRSIGKLPKKIRSAYSVWRNILVHDLGNIRAGLTGVIGLYLCKNIIRR